MRKWYMPAALLGLGGVSALLMSGRGRTAVRWLVDRIYDAPEKLLEWNEAAQRELEQIQTALNRVADSLEAVR
jgi:cell division septum initiation protein DivIVA